MDMFRSKGRSWLIAIGAALAVGCGGEEPSTGVNPTQPPGAGTSPLPASGSAGLAGSVATAGIGSVNAGRGLAGIGAGGTLGGGAAGQGASGTGMTGTAGIGAAGMAVAGSSASAGTGSAGMMGVAGSAGMAAAGMGGAPPTGVGMGSCCNGGDCLCHGPDPTGLTSMKGPYRTAEMRASTGTLHYPMDADPPFAGVAICAGYFNTGPEMEPWGEFYASWGIVTMVTSTSGSDQPATRARKLLAAVAEMKEMATGSGPISGKMSGRYGTSGYSMGGGGTTIAATDDATLKTSIGLAPYGGRGTGTKVPTLLLCGSSDGTAPCSMASGVYRSIPGDTPKMMVTISGATHFAWFGPTEAGGGLSGKMALAFQKVFLEGDERWRPLLVDADANKMTNIE